MLQASLINQRSHIKKKVRLWLCFSFKCFKSKLWFGVFPVQLGLCSFISQIYKYRSGPGSRPETETVIKILQLRFTMTPNIGGRVIMMRAFVHIHFVLYVLINTWKWSFKLLLLPQSSCYLFFLFEICVRPFVFLAREQDYTKTTQQISTKLGWRIWSRPRIDPVTFRCRSR